ncbi:hypothetical protein PVAP13_9KG574001 [Panicum virgatum]|uniref:Uncharacterized protein n=1 Tax=Panicum virgatum TaxID=38727 RepID=A0A8T0NZX6_PANVG|nr:hypothetical protein PVAP13_9KG574001 [Panicum virgatum]
MWNPLSWVMEMAAVIAIGLANGDHRPPDWQDFVGIVVLLVLNPTISFIEENNAGSAAKELMANLAPRTKVLRDGRWSGGPRPRGRHKHQARRHRPGRRAPASWLTVF